MRKVMLCLVVLGGMMTRMAQAQEIEYRWGKTFKGWEDGNSAFDNVYDSYIDSLGNTYVFGRFAPKARLGQNGPYISWMDSVDTYRYSFAWGAFLAKIDSTGGLVWWRWARGSEHAAQSNPWNMVVKDDKITVALDCSTAYYSWGWYYLFDTMICEPSNRNRPNLGAAYFVTFDLDGNLLERHRLQLFFQSDPALSPTTYLQTKAVGGRARFCIDEDNSLHIFASCGPGHYDPANLPYLMVDGDTSRKLTYYDQGCDQTTGTTHAKYIKIDRDWNIVELRPFIRDIAEWDSMKYTSVDFVQSNEDGDNIYVCGSMYNQWAKRMRTRGEVLCCFPARVYLDSTHYLKVENQHDFADGFPFVMKMNKEGEIAWVQQLYTAISESSWRSDFYELGTGVAVDEESVYFKVLLHDSDNQFIYLDSAHTIQTENHHLLSYELISRYDKETGAFEDYYLVDTVNRNDTRSIVVQGDYILLNLRFFPSHDSRLCKINKHTKEVIMTPSLIQFSSRSDRDDLLSINDNGWVFRGNEGADPVVLDSISLGLVDHAGVMTFWYDPALDLRKRPCPEVDTLWSESQGGRTVTLRWESEFEHAGYELAYVAEGEEWETATTLAVAGNWATVELPDDRCHVFRVRGLCTGKRQSQSEWSEELRVCPEVGVEEAEGTRRLTLSPNPAEGWVTVVGLKDKAARVTVMDMRGRVLKSWAEADELEVGDLPAGSYIVKVETTDGGVEYLKMVKK